MFYIRHLGHQFRLYKSHCWACVPFQNVFLFFFFTYAHSSVFLYVHPSLCYYSPTVRTAVLNLHNTECRYLELIKLIFFFKRGEYSSLADKGDIIFTLKTPYSLSQVLFLLRICQQCNTFISTY